jgi:hypothetical protein
VDPISLDLGLADSARWGREGGISSGENPRVVRRSSPGLIADIALVPVRRGGGGAGALSTLTHSSSGGESPYPGCIGFR